MTVFLESIRSTEKENYGISDGGDMLYLRYWNDILKEIQF
ncbi:hypothetical protein CSW65_03010 [Streptococcus agalactiae]|nr:hypothetical protein B8V02_01940 [Streptococcus agalactiae]PHU33080.1 hypothetical protein CSW65_03010 [Streptococcus agalactiae]RRA59643.1 hypothetical protein D5F95_06875 [Streptococcus agalactiae]RRB03370.1 hypothetical protein D5F93_06495 [Streptococcus agalactiae]